jgi:hypothetical protein
MTPAIFYVYEYWRPDTDVCFYVGKGKGNRAWRLNRKNGHYRNIIDMLARIGLCVEVRLVRGELIEAEALQLEKERIAFWRSAGVPLTNQTDGGEGIPGFTHTLEARSKISTSGRKRTHSPESLAKMSASIKKVFANQALRDQISASLKKTLATPEGRAKRIAARRRRELARTKK